MAEMEKFMKKIKLLLVLMLAFALSFTLIACNKCESHIDENKDAKCDVCGEKLPCEEHEDSDRNGKCDVCSEAVPVSDDYVLFEDGEPKFQIVLGAGLSLDAQSLVNDYVKSLKKIGVELTVVEDKEETIAEYEVLIGNVKSRGDEYKYDMYTKYCNNRIKWNSNNRCRK